MEDNIRQRSYEAGHIDNKSVLGMDICWADNMHGESAPLLGELLQMKQPLKRVTQAERFTAPCSKFYFAFSST